MKCLRRVSAVAGMAVMTAFAPVSATAAPLEPEACSALTVERTGLISQGVESDMARGAAWARQNLPDSRLEQIKRLIELNEQLSFRCGLMVTARPTLIERTPPPVQAATNPTGEPQKKKPTKSKPKPEAAASPAGTPGVKKQPPKDAPAKQATAPQPKTVTEIKAAPALKPSSAPSEPTGN